MTVSYHGRVPDTILRLQVADVTSESSWRWELLDESNKPLARHTVALTAADLASTKVLDLYRSLWRIDTQPTRRAESELAIMGSLGDFIGERVLGEIGEALLHRTPATVIVELGSEAVVIAGYPLELARSHGVALTAVGITWCYRPSPAPTLPSVAAIAPLRILAVFASPVDSSALALVRERREMSRTIASLGHAVQLTVLQHGVTRAALAEAIADERGWDVIHIAGHGVAGALHLEREDGSRDSVTVGTLLELLESVGTPIHLVVLSACESGIARAARRGLAVKPAVLSHRPAVTLDSLAYQVATRVGCSVVAMRYPVDDRYSVAFAQSFYRGLFVDGLELRAAFHQAVDAASSSPGVGPLAAATAMLFTADPSQRLPTGELEPTQPGYRRPAEMPPEAAFFVGRTVVLAGVASVLAPGSPVSAIALIGMPAIGKTSTLVEAVEIYGASADRVVWHQLQPSHDVSELRLALGLATSLTDRQAAALIRNQRLILVIDDAHHCLRVDGTWHSEQFGAFLDAVIEPGGAARVLLSSERPLSNTRLVRQAPLPLLSRTETELLSRELAEFSLSAEDETKFHMTWLACVGHPGLIIGMSGAESEKSGTDDRIRAWTTSSLAPLTGPPEALLACIAALEPADRDLDVLEWLWPFVCEATARATPSGASPRDALEPMISAGLVQFAGESVVMHPAVADAIRASLEEVVDLTTYAMAHHWEGHHDAWVGRDVNADVLSHCAASAVPYLIRRGDWEAASTRVEQAIHHDMTPSTAARLLPSVNEIVRATSDTALRRSTRYVRATIVTRIHRDKGLAALTELYREADDAGDSAVLVATATAIATLTAETSLVQARDWLKTVVDRARQHDIDALASIVVRLKLAKLEQELGVPPEISAATAAQLSDELHQLIGIDEERGRANLPTVLAELREFAGAAARYSEPGSAMSRRDTIREQFNALSGDDDDPDSYGRAEEMLVAILDQFKEDADQLERALVLGRLAKIRFRRGNSADAQELTRRALLTDYAVSAGLQAAQDHRQLADVLAVSGDLAGATRHLLADAVIRLRVSEGAFVFLPGGDPELQAAIWAVKLLLARHSDLIPGSYAELRRLLLADLGVDVEHLIAGSRRQPLTLNPETGLVDMTTSPHGDGDSLSDVIALASTPFPASELIDPERLEQHWSLLAGVVAAARHGQATAELERLLTLLRTSGWSELVTALDSVVLGETNSALTDLTGIDRAVVTYVIASLDSAERTG